VPDDHTDPQLILDVASLNLTKSEKVLKHFAEQQVRRQRLLRMHHLFKEHRHECHLAHCSVQDFLQMKMGYLLAVRNMNPEPDEWSDHFLELMVETTEQIVQEYDDHEKRILRQRVRDLTSDQH